MSVYSLNVNYVDKTRKRKSVFLQHAFTELKSVIDLQLLVAGLTCTDFYESQTSPKRFTSPQHRLVFQLTHQARSQKTRLPFLSWPPTSCVSLDRLPNLSVASIHAANGDTSHLLYF